LVETGDTANALVNFTKCFGMDGAMCETKGKIEGVEGMEGK